MKIIFRLFFIFLPMLSLAQHPSETVKDKNLYGSETKWSCADKHFGYYFLNYSKPIPLETSIENEIRSGLFSAGYTYRHKIISMFDIGAELSYQNRRSTIDKSSNSVFDPGTFYDKFYTFHNSITANLFIRINLKGADYRNLGYFVDLGAGYSYAYSYGSGYILKNESINQKTRFKRPYYLDPLGYNLFMRAGYNNIAVILSWNASNWIIDYSNQNLSFDRSPLMIGLQMNLYAK
ncbi:MAG: hypothetical protein PHE56_05950 [Bacteroidales bacterium]|nr:hypothetical protein [Bacteroidales bacterium]